MLPILGSLISAGTSLLGGKMASDATKDANAQNQRNFEQQMRSVEAQRDQDFDRQQIFAKQGIQWRAQDARDAGIHPLYALGANIPTYSGSVSTVGAPSIAADTSMGSAVASMGQDIGRAINSTRTGSQREEAFNTTVQGLTLQKMGLENQLLASQIKRLQVQSNPPFPSATPSENNPTTKLSMGGFPIQQDAGTSPAEAYENRYGEFLGDLAGAAVAYNDWKKTTGGTMTLPFSAADVGQKVYDLGSWLDRNLKVSPGSFAETRQYLPNFMRAPAYRTGYGKYGPR